jgi:hypothetical protein
MLARIMTGRASSLRWRQQARRPSEPPHPDDGAARNRWRPCKTAATKKKQQQQRNEPKATKAKAKKNSSWLSEPRRLWTAMLARPPGPGRLHTSAAFAQSAPRCTQATKALDEARSTLALYRGVVPSLVRWCGRMRAGRRPSRPSAGRLEVRMRRKARDGRTAQRKTTLRNATQRNAQKIRVRAKRRIRRRTLAALWRAITARAGTHSPRSRGQRYVLYVPYA